MEISGAFPQDGGTTGRSLVLFEQGGTEAGMAAVQEAIGAEVVTATGDEAAPAEGGGVLFESLGVAVVDAPPEQLLQAAGETTILAVEPERIVYAFENTPYTPPDTNGHAELPVAPPLMAPVATRSAATAPRNPQAAAVRSADRTVRAAGMAEVGLPFEWPLRAFAV